MTMRQDLATSELTELLFEEPGVGRCLIAPDGTILRANAEWLRATSLTLQEVLGADFVELFPDTRELTLAIHARARGGHRVEVPRHARRLQGRETWWEGSVAPVPMEGGAGLLVTAREVTPGRGAHIDAIERNFRALTEAMPQIVCVLRPDGAPEYVNPHWVAFSGLDLLETARAGWDGVLHPDDVGAAYECRRRALKLLTPQDVELRYRAADGTYRWFLSRLAPIVEGGRVVRLVGAAMDIDDRRRAEQGLRESEERLRQANEHLSIERRKLEAVIRTLPVGIGITDARGNPLSMNEAALRLHGFTSEAEMLEQLDRHPEQLELRYLDGRLVPLEEWPGSKAERGEFLTDAEFRLRNVRVASERTVTTTVVPVSDPAGNTALLVCLMGDVTERKQAEEALCQAVERYERQVRLFDRVASTTPDFVYLFDRQGRFLYANRRLLEVWGMQLPDVVGKTWRELGYEQWYHDMHMREVAQVIETKRPIKGEVTFEAPLTAAFGVYEYIFTPVTDPEGEVEIIAGTARDVTERKQSEEALREADRRKDEFLGMLSHELRNPLAPIRNSIYILRHTAAGSDQALRAQSVIERQTEHLTRLVDDLLDVTRIARGKIELRRSRVDLREVVSRAAEDFRVVMRDRSVAFDVVIPEVKLWADTDPTRITQVVGNLLHNASKFTRRGDRVTLSLHATDGAAEIRVRDTGAGIDPALLPSIFDPFVQGERTLARTEGGLGLGLALVKGITELHGGAARVESAGKGKGAEFIVRLPLASTARLQDEGTGTGGRSNGGRRVLVVDDNTDSAESLADVLKVLGHTVEVAYDGPSALERARASPPDAVVCDIGLPGMSGYDVAQALRATAPKGLQLIALSGYAQPDDVKRAVQAGFDGHLAKPADPAELERLLGT